LSSTNSSITIFSCFTITFNSNKTVSPSSNFIISSMVSSITSNTSKFNSNLTSRRNFKLYWCITIRLSTLFRWNLVCTITICLKFNVITVSEWLKNISKMLIIKKNILLSYSKHFFIKLLLVNISYTFVSINWIIPVLCTIPYFTYNINAMLFIPKFFH